MFSFVKVCVVGEGTVMTGLGVGSMTGGASETLSTRRLAGLWVGCLCLEEELSDTVPGPREPPEVSLADLDFGCKESVDFWFKELEGC